MNKKVWKEKLIGVNKLKKASEFNEKREIDNQEELDVIISAIQDKIATFK